ncbi:MAG: nicotinate phosphoribosyltransferase [Bacillota bacterium]|nr:nicotinate phosphoribosyltransferase [Bacillota bacterium]
MNNNTTQNYTMLCDFYELTMGNGYFQSNIGNKIVYFDVFFRDIPDGGGFAIACGLEQVIDYLENLKFDDEDIEYLKSKNTFSEDFLNYLKNFNFECDVYAVPEGTPIFPGEPILTVRGPAIQAQLVETFLLLTLNHQSLIATKASRIVRAAKGRAVSEFGSRRSQGPSAAILGARAAYIAGCSGTACTITDRLYGVPASGTMAHSWVQMFDSELEAFKAYARLYPSNTILLVDTYNVLKSGIPNAIKAFNEVILPLGLRPKGIRIDSGDITYLSRRARKMLDEAGFNDCLIFASNSLDEYIIRDTLEQGAYIDAFGVGERLVTSKSDPVFGGVYKLAAVENDKGEIIPKIKISENVTKITNPHYKKPYRLFERDTNKAIADLICVYDEVVDDTKPLEIFDPDYTWKRKTLMDFYAVPLHKQIFEKGKLVYKQPNIEEIRNYCLSEIDKLWDEVLRFDNPHRFYVDLSEKLWDIKQQLLKQFGQNTQK